LKITEENIMETPEKIRETLAYATGSEKVWRMFPGRDDFLITEGVKAMADMCEAYWLLTDIAAWFCETKVRRESFTDWTETGRFPLGFTSRQSTAQA